MGICGCSDRNPLKNNKQGKIEEAFANGFNDSNISDLDIAIYIDNINELYSLEDEPIQKNHLFKDI